MKEIVCAPSSTPATRPTSSGGVDRRPDSALQGEIAREGWTLVQVYRDAAISGATTLRPGYRTMLEGGREAAFDVVVAEALDRLSRDQEDIAALFKRLQFAGIRLVTLGEGEIGALHIGLKGTMNALFLKDLADKTRRGLRGRVEAGKSGGGNAYGYDVVRSYHPNGAPIRGSRTINAAEADVVREIFVRYAGEAPRRIAFDLNARRIPAPRSAAWSGSTLNGNRARGSRHTQQRDVYRTTGLEPAELRQGSRTPASGDLAPTLAKPSSPLKRRNSPSCRESFGTQSGRGRRGLTRDHQPRSRPEDRPTRDFRSGRSGGRAICFPG